MQAEMIVDFLDLGRELAQSRPQFDIFRVLEWNYGIQTVVTAGQLDDNENGILGAGLVRGGHSGSGTTQKDRSTETPTDQADAAQRRFQEITTIRSHGNTPRLGERGAGTPRAPLIQLKLR